MTNSQPAGASHNASPPASNTRDAGFVAALVVLSISTGMLDGVSYHALDHVFTGNMTGNVLFLGFSLGGEQQLPILNLLVALGIFFLGAVTAARIIGIRPSRERVPRATTAILACGTVATSAVALGWAVIGPPDRIGVIVITGVLAFFLGAQASALKPVGIGDVNTVVVTMTMVNLAHDGILAGKRDPHWLRKLLAIVAMVVGAFVGTALYFSFGAPVATAGGAVVMASGVVVLRVVSNRATRSPKL